MNKTVIIFEISTRKFLKVKKVHVKAKKNKFGSKISIIWVHFRLEFLKTIAIFQISTLEFFKFQSFGQNQKFLNWNENALFGCSGQHF